MTKDSPKTESESGSGDYEVGYKKPPRRTQFRKGKSGNPAGRPKRAVDVRASLNNMLAGPIRVTIDGKRTKMSTLDAALLNLRTKMLNGEPQAFNTLFKMVTAAGMIKLPEESQTEVAMSSNDEQMLVQALTMLGLEDSSKETGRE